MSLGIFAKTFARPTLAETLDAVVAHGLLSIQLNLQSAGLASMPGEIPVHVVDEVRRETERRGIAVSSLSGTFNMIHPDPTVVEQGLARLEVLARSARSMGADFISLCTGSRDPDNMWRRHPDNDSEDAWNDLLMSMGAALAIAERHDLALGVEPEPGNVINSAAKCCRLIDHFGSPSLKVVFDPANLVSTDLARDPFELLEEAFDLLGRDVAIGHGKDCGPNGKIVPAGRGIIPWKLVLDRLKFPGFGRDIPLIIHGVEESDVAEVVAFLRSQSDSPS